VRVDVEEKENELYNDVVTYKVLAVGYQRLNFKLVLYLQE
jgi:hypothetical protein